MMSLNKKTIDDIEVNGKRVLVRCDFNVPLQNGVITNDTRIRAAMPTIRSLQKRGARIILCSHLGRPKGVFSPEYSLRPVSEALSGLLKAPILMAEDVVGPSAVAMAEGLHDGDIMMLENLRFHKEETGNDTEFSKKLAGLADLFVNDAFGTAHRAHASTAGVTAFLPAVCGYLIEKEIRVMGDALKKPDRPFVAVVGGAKVSDKIGVIRNLISTVDVLLIGGGMSYTFMKVKGLEIGDSLVENDKLDLASELLAEAKRRGMEFCLPVDYLAGDRFAPDCNVQVVTEIPDGWMGLDIGPATRTLYADLLKTAKTVIWNGPMGVFEFEAFASGTLTVAKAIAESGAVSIIGGGDSVAAVEQLGYGDRMTHISTGGGATLEFLEGLELPGIAALDDK